MTNCYYIILLIIVTDLLNIIANYIGNYVHAIILSLTLVDTELIYVVYVRTIASWLVLKYLVVIMINYVDNKVLQTTILINI